MQGLMMHTPLTLTWILRRGLRMFPDKEVVSRFPDGVHRCTFAELYARVERLANALRALGVKPGDRVATLAWNHHRHMELYYAVPALGAVLHTLNIRLPAHQLGYIVNHAGDTLLFADADLAPLLEPLADQMPGLRGRVLMPDSLQGRPRRDGWLDYESLLAGAETRAEFPEFSETTACMLCYSSGTTGDPKGVLYSHRAQVLQCLIAGITDNFRFSERDTLLAIAPMFHVNGWGLPFQALLVGASLVFAGSRLDAASLVELINAERVTFTNGVPTIWVGVLEHLRRQGLRLESLQQVLIGGAPVPKPLIAAFVEEYGVALREAWGMTETAPPGRPNIVTSAIDALPPQERARYVGKSAKVGPCEEIQHIDEAGRVLPWDGETMGELCVRGTGIAGAYYNNPQATAAAFHDGWLRTGDIVTIDRFGNYQVMDRAKDLIKSGGEWISSVALQNAAMTCPGVAEAAAVARSDAKWGERPVLFVSPRDSAAPPATEAILGTIAERFAKWQLPDVQDIRVVPEIPKTSVGKFDKKRLRELLQAQRAPDEATS
ncbi:MAG: long-chain fatty acid--CoA ligase [Candidatus Lambdaproteobacteria bacterium]|nr:long-chain fatty acid--CoA ligase [Candidatus Lambdaproteobacteria bacterium]